ncbi:cytochrome c oxidase subunit 3 [Bacteriovoracaceae bacterium]|nr:cytochrome c oxidase subunit 3 [Bacteriovoracaceae bacterium]
MGTLTTEKIDRLGRKVQREESLFDSKTVALFLIIGAEMMVFAGLLTAFQVLKVNQVMWPPYGMPKFPAMITGINTIILISSGIFLEVFVRKKMTAFYLSSLIALIAFVSIQVIEWFDLVQFGLEIVGGVYGGIYLLVIGFHATHVLFSLGWMLIHFFKGWTNTEMLRIYLWFVILVWPFVYAIVYF